jgi:hypothetical protein
MDFFYLDHFDNLPNHADAFQISPRLDHNLRSEAFSEQILSGLSSQLEVLTVSCPENPAAAFYPRSVYHTLDRDCTWRIVLRRSARAEEDKGNAEKISRPRYPALGSQSGEEIP